MSLRSCNIAQCPNPVWHTMANRCYRHLAQGHSKGYLRSYMPCHSKATKDGTALVHQVIVYDRHQGKGIIPCYHGCGRGLSHHVPWWSSSAVTVDHLDWDRRNNSEANLVASCRSCGSRRTAEYVARRTTAMKPNKGAMTMAVAA